jgi:hypothetical protein
LVKKEQKIIKNFRRQQRANYCWMFFTGTHGSAIDVGSVPDFIVGMHIITGPDKHIWLERESYPIVSDVSLKSLKQNLLRMMNFSMLPCKFWQLWFYSWCDDRNGRYLPVRKLSQKNTTG